jgi:hypothetical protein
MTDTKKNKAKRENRQKLDGKSSHTSFYGGLKSKNELYFQMASLFKEATKGNQPLKGQWIDRIMVSQRSNTSGKFF